MKAKVTTNLVSILDAGIVDEQRQSNHFHASGLRKCGRKQVLSLLGYKEARVSKPEWLRAAAMGDLIHDYVTEICQAQGILEAAEQPIEVDPEYFVSGRVDAILNRNGNRRPLEIKSKNSKKFKMFYPGDEGFEDAYAQLQWYLFALKTEGGFILAVNRDNLTWREFSVAADESYIMALLARAKRLKTHLDNKTLPAPERTSECKFCGYQGTIQCPNQEEQGWL